jgi:hypothetical protein
VSRLSKLIEIKVLPNFTPRTSKNSLGDELRISTLQTHKDQDLDKLVSKIVKNSHGDEFFGSIFFNTHKSRIGRASDKKSQELPSGELFV